MRIGYPVLCEGPLRTHSALEAFLHAIVTSDNNGFALSQAHIWDGVSGAHDLLPLKASIDPTLK